MSLEDKLQEVRDERVKLNERRTVRDGTDAPGV